MAVSSFDGLERFESLGLGEGGNMPKQIPADTSRLKILADRNRDFADFEISVASQHGGRKNFCPAIDESQKVFGPAMVDRCHRDKAVMSHVFQPRQKSKPDVVRRDMREELGERSFVRGLRSAHSEAKPRSRC